MRGGAQLRCVVNGAAGQERRSEGRTPAGERAHRGDRRGARRPHLCVAGGASGNTGDGLRARAAPGGSFRYAGKAPLFQDVVADENSFDRYVRPARGRARQGRHLPLRTSTCTHARTAGTVRPHRDRDRRRLPLRPRPARDRVARPWRRSLAAASRRFFRRNDSRLVLSPGPDADRRGAARRWRSPARRSW